MKLPNPYTQRKLAEALELLPRNGPFAAINVSFHVTYTRLVEQVLAQLGDSVPVVVVIGDDATILCDGREQREQVIPARYHELKALAHLAFGVQLTLMANGRGQLTELTANELHEKRTQIRDAHAAANSAYSTPMVTNMLEAPAELLCRARSLAEMAFCALEGAFLLSRATRDVTSIKTAVARRNYVNSVDASAGTADRLRTFDDYSGSPTQHTNAGWDNVTGLGTPTSALLSIGK